MARRKPFETPQPTEPTPAPLAASPSATLDALAYLRLPEKKKRQRSWEREHTPKSYRGVPADLRDAVRAAAENLNVTVDDLARAFLEYSLDCVSRGALRLEIRYSPRVQRLSLYPFSGASWAARGWNPQPPPAPARRRKAAEDARPWQQLVSYRIPDELHQQIKAQAEGDVPLGEVVTILLQHALTDYRSGALALFPQPRMAAKVHWESA